MDTREDLVVVYVSQGPLAAEVAKGKLESNGIVAILKYEAVGRAFGLTVDGLGRVEVLVRPEDEDAALSLLEELSEEDLAADPPPEPREL
jgi:hypothetical protein